MQNNSGRPNPPFYVVGTPQSGQTNNPTQPTQQPNYFYRPIAQAPQPIHQPFQQPIQQPFQQPIAQPQQPAAPRKGGCGCGGRR